MTTYYGIRRNSKRLHLLEESTSGKGYWALCGASFSGIKQEQYTDESICLACRKVAAFKLLQEAS